MAPLPPWIERQYRHAAAQMLLSVSAVGIVHSRPGFGQQMRPHRGSIVASPVPGAYDPDPDYFFHWFRDSALIVDALRLLAGDAAAAGIAAQTTQAHLADFVRFSLALQQLDGRRLTASSQWRARVAPQFVRYLRTDAELAAVHGEAVAGETRVNPDGSLDISQWARPQHDGPALRALTLLRWSRLDGLDGALRASLAELLRADLAYALAHAREPCFDIWEEEQGLHYYTVRVTAAALSLGATWLERNGGHELGQACRTQAQALTALLDSFWLEPEGYYRSRILPSAARSSKELDIAVILAALHAGDAAGGDGSGDDGRHSVHDPRMYATLARLTALFDAQYAINRSRPATLAPAMGRYAEDRYYAGGAYYFSTLGAAEFCYRAAAGAARMGAAARAADAAALYERGDAFLRTVRAFTPPSGDMSEQFDQRTGAPASARQLAWSYAACISCFDARRRAGALIRTLA
jgi:glucoamylase